VLNRRRFLFAVAGVLTVPLAGEAQQARKIYRIGHIFTGDLDLSWPAFVQGLSSHGWVEGKNIVFEYRQIVLAPDGSFSNSIQRVAEEFVRIKVDVIVIQPAGWAKLIQKTTGTIPIVVLGGAELVASGVVASLARPGGYITGMQTSSPELQGKRLQILKELVPTLSRVTVLRRGKWDPGFVAAYRQSADDAAQKLDVRLRYIFFDNSDELPSVFAGMVKERDAAILIWWNPPLHQHIRQILDLAVQHRLPTIADSSLAAESGALVAYSGKRADLWKQAATHVDRILKGAKPADLPVEQPTKFELVINMKTAKALGLTIPQSVLVRADQIIQ